MVEILKSNITFLTNDIAIFVVVKLSVAFHMTSGSFSLSN